MWELWLQYLHCDGKYTLLMKAKIKYPHGGVENTLHMGYKNAIPTWQFIIQIVNGGTKCNIHIIF
jgi:hypothetical protein